MLFTILDRLFSRGSRQYRRNTSSLVHRRRLLCESLEQRQMLSANVATNLPDYSPGQTALITGSGYQANEIVDLQILNESMNPATLAGVPGSWSVQADDQGNFQTSWLCTSDLAGAILELYATGESSGLTASERFTDTPQAISFDYSFTGADVNANSNHYSAKNLVAIHATGLTSGTIYYVSVNDSGNNTPLGTGSFSIPSGTTVDVNIYSLTSFGDGNGQQYKLAISTDPNFEQDTNTQVFKVGTPNLTGTTIVGVSDGGTYDGTPHSATGSVNDGSTNFATPTFTYYAGTHTDVTGLNALSGAPINAGDYTVVASYPGDATHAAATSVIVSFSIAKAPSTTTTVGAGPFTYNGSAHIGGSGTVAGAGTVTGSATVTYSANSDGTGTADQTNAGTYYVTAHYAGDANHTASDGAAVAITINKATSSTTTVGAGPFTYTGNAQVGGSGTVSGANLSTSATSLTYSANADGTGTADQTNAGTYYVTAHYAGDANHTASDGAAVAITINKATSSTTTVGAGPFTYTGNAQVGGSGTVSGANLSTSATSLTYSANADGTGTADQTNAGTYYVTAHYAGDASHTASDGVAVAIVIKKACLTVNVANDSKIFGTAAKDLATDLGATVDTGVNSENLKIAYSSNGNTATASVGTYALTGVLSNGSGLLSNYKVTINPGTFTVNAANTSVSLAAAVSGTSMVITATVVSTNSPAVVNEGSVKFIIDGVNYAGTVTGSGPKFSISIPAGYLSAGTHIIGAVFTDGVGNFNGSSDTGSLVAFEGTDGKFFGGGIGYWTNKNGAAFLGLHLSDLQALHLVGANGQVASLTSVTAVQKWIKNATATNMSYMLSAQLAALQLDVLNGWIKGSQLLDASKLSAFKQLPPGVLTAEGYISVSNLIAIANAALIADSKAVSGNANRAYQEALKNLCEKAANNQGFINWGAFTDLGVPVV